MLDSKLKDSPPTIEEIIRAKSKLLNKWVEANPGLKWESPEYPEGDNIYITKEMLYSPAYRSLSRAAMLAYQDFLSLRIMEKNRRKKVWAIKNNGMLVYPYTEAVKNGYTRATFRNAIDELQIKGFIDITHIGKGGPRPAEGTGDYTTYWIDDRWQDYDAKNQKSNRPPRKPRPKETRPNRGFKPIWNDPEKAAVMMAKRKKTAAMKAKRKKNNF